VRYAFVVGHRSVFSVRAMCRCLCIHPSGFYAWLKNPLSRRAREDIRQTELVRAAWKESGKVYGYRKLHDDLLDHAARTALHGWPDLPASRRGSATGAGLVPMVASHPWSSTTHWTGSSMWKHQTGSG